MMVLSSDLTFSILCSNIFEYSFLALVRISFGLEVRLSVMLTPVSSNFFLFLNIIFLTLYLANMMLIGLDCLCFEVFLSNDFDLYQYLWVFLAKGHSRFLSKQYQYLHSHFPSHHVTKYSFCASIALACQWLYLNHQFFIHLRLFFQFIDFLLFISVISLQFVTLFIGKFYKFN